jgi:predicted amidophosphoribosyltransferase
VPTVAELTELYGNFMLSPRPGPGVCETCFNPTAGYERCYACTHNPTWLDVVAPISYSIAHEQLHHALAGYKRPPQDVARRFALELAAVLWRHLETHEACIARAAGTDAFEVVATVPSSSRARDGSHPLRQIVGQVAGPTRARYQPLLKRSDAPAPAHTFSVGKYQCAAELSGESVLLVDDTWTTGANAQSATAVLKTAGAGRVGVVVLGRHVNRRWHHNDRHLSGLTAPFNWSRCAFCASGLEAD